MRLEILSTNRGVHARRTPPFQARYRDNLRILVDLPQRGPHSCMITQ